MSGAELILAVGQIVLTATSVVGVGSVLITVQGVPHAWPTASGVTQSVALHRDDFATLLPADKTLDSVPAGT